jgi:hypothetical protein
MARSPIPSALDMRELKYGGRSDAEKDRVAALLSQRGRHAEAILLLQGRATSHPLARQELEEAREEGRAFRLLALRRLGVVVTDEDLTTCARAAEAAGRWMDARQCWRALGDEEALARVAEHVPESLRERKAP